MRVTDPQVGGTQLRSDPAVPLVTAVFPEAALAAPDAVESLDRLHPGDELGVLVADVTLDPQPQRRAVAHRARRAVHVVGQDGLRMEGIEQVDAFVVEAAAIWAAHHLVEAMEDDIARLWLEPGLAQHLHKRHAGPLPDRSPAFIAIVLGNLGARRH